MNSMKNWFRSVKLRYKMLILFSILIAVFVLNISYFSFKKTESYLDELSNNAYKEMLVQANVTAELQIKNYERIINTLYISDEFQKLLTSSYQTAFDKYIANNRIKDFVESILNTYENMPDINIYLFNQNTFSGIVYPVSDITDLFWKDEVLKYSAAGVHWVQRRLELPNGSYYKLVAAKALRNSANNSVYGILSLEIDPTFIYNQISNLELFKEGNVFVLDLNGTIIYSLNNYLAEKPGQPFRFSRKLNGQSGSFIENIDGTNYFVVYDKMLHRNSTLVGITPIQGALQISNEVRDYNIRMAILLILLGIAIIYFLSRLFTRRISLLTSEMLKVSRGTPGIQLDMESNDEIGKMNRVFHMMLSKLNKNMEEMSELKTREFELQLKALQAQINPHFLYNTLSTINWMAMSLNADDISLAINALAKYYRTGLNNGKEIVTVNEELEHIKSYIYIQKIRVKDNIDFRFSIDPEALPYLLPKMVLQPIVENAIQHGIEKQRKRGIITIDIKKSDKYIYFEVSDDGTGMPESEAASLLTSIHDKGSYGLYHIDSKIKLYFGSTYGLSISSAENLGTKVTITIPTTRQIQ
ncbi:sensor histidine kinase [Paenibacillus baekrokdamisoli]|nr:sensor histidine kinase [Paenibacillus baekrokdamisoli]